MIWCSCNSTKNITSASCCRLSNAARKVGTRDDELHGELFVHILEQPVERKDNEDEEHAPDHIGERAGFEDGDTERTAKKVSLA